MTIAYDAEMLPDHHWWTDGRARALLRIIEDHVPLGGPALDAGAGNGFWGQHLCRRFDPVTLLEPDTRLQQAIEARSLPANLLEGSLPGPLPFADRSFSLVSCLDVIEHIVDDRASVSELHRVMNQSGYLLLTVPAHPHLWSQHDVAVRHQRRYTKVMVENLISSAGLQLELLAPLNVWLYPMAWVARKLNQVGDRLPNPSINKAMTALFASEGRMVDRWPSFVRGLSWVALSRKG